MVKYSVTSLRKIKSLYYNDVDDAFVFIDKGYFRNYNFVKP